MAKAAFEKGQRVYVRAVGVWATIEKVVPQWVKGVDEPFRVFYDVGLGREFSAHELAAPASRYGAEIQHEAWTVRRVTSGGLRTDRGRPVEDTIPVVVTDPDDWGGWRVDPIEYDRDPSRIEHQARLISQAPRLLAAAKALATHAETLQGRPVDGALAEAIRAAHAALRAVYAAEPEAEADAGLAPLA